jgi:hydroxymethylpyrimidine pyrophosphatase-like HAD family hydrolase
VVKIVGVSDDQRVMDDATRAVAHDFGAHISSAQSQPYYLDVTHPDANKGAVALFLSERLGIPTEQIATIGDQPNDVLMFARTGLSIAMGNSSSEVQRAADRVTGSNEDEGFASAVERFVLPRA